MPLIGSSDYDNASVDSSLNSEMIEKDPEEIRAGIQIKRLAKEFETDSGRYKHYQALQSSFCSYL